MILIECFHIYDYIYKRILLIPWIVQMMACPHLQPTSSVFCGVMGISDGASVLFDANVNVRNRISTLSHTRTKKEMH